MAAPILTLPNRTITIDELALKAGPILIAPDATITDADKVYFGMVIAFKSSAGSGNFGLVTEGTGTGQVGGSLGNITYGGVTVASAMAFAGVSAVTITFNTSASVTQEAVNAVLHHISFYSDDPTPTPTREIVIDVRDEVKNGLDLLPGRLFSFNAAPGRPAAAASGTGAASVDIGGDDDFDFFYGQADGTIAYRENIGTRFTPNIVARSGAANPLNGIDVGETARLSFGDLDADGDKDLVIGAANGTLTYYRNSGTVAAPAFTLVTDADGSPLAGFSSGNAGDPELGDLDGDGDLDLIVGLQTAAPLYFENIGTASDPNFSARLGARNPFAALTTPALNPTLLDIDNDGDLDVVFHRMRAWSSTRSTPAPGPRQSSMPRRGYCPEIWRQRTISPWSTSTAIRT